MIPIPPSSNEDENVKISGNIGESEIQQDFSIRTMQEDLKKTKEMSNLSGQKKDGYGSVPLADSLSSTNINISEIDNKKIIPIPGKLLNPQLPPPPLPEQDYSHIPTPVSGSQKFSIPEMLEESLSLKQEIAKKTQREPAEKSSDNAQFSKIPDQKVPHIPVSDINEILEPKTQKNKIVLLSAAALLGLSAVSLGIYFSIPFIKKIFVNTPPAQTNNPIPPAEEPVENPQIITNEFNLLNFSNEYDFNISSNAYKKQFNSGIKSVLLDKINSKDIIIPQTRFLSIQMSVDEKFLEGEDIIDGLTKNFPPAVLDKIDRKNNLLLYSQNKEPRIGLVFQLLSDKDLIVWLRQWESTMAEDLKNLFMDNLGNGISTSGIFQDTMYKETPIRYLNLSSHSAAIDYAIVDNMLIITTSRDSMFELINYVQNQTQYQ